MEQLTDLLKQLQSVHKGNRELDCLIFETFAMPKEFFGSKIISFLRSPTGVYVFNTEDGYRHLEATQAPKYTTSLDDAFTLLPVDPENEISGTWDWQLESTNGALTISACIGPEETRAFADTPPLAVCASCIKAHILGK